MGRRYFFIPLERLQDPRAQPEPPETGEQADAEPEVDAVEITDAVEEAPPEIQLWKGSCELGFNGSEGNTETLNFRFGFDAKRKTDLNIIDLDLDYHKKTADNEETANRMFLDSRYELLNGDSPWTSFVHQTTEYDEFKAYDVRVSLDTGIGYQFIDNDQTTLGVQYQLMQSVALDAQAMTGDRGTSAQAGATTSASL